MDHGTEEKNIGLNEKYEDRLGGAAPHLLSENGLRKLRLVRRMRSQSISSLTSFIVTDAVATSDHLEVHTLAVLVSHSSYVHRPAARHVALEVAHEPLTISQHLHPRPLAHGSSIAITEELRAGLRHFVCSGTEYLFSDNVGL